ncbi:MAG: glycosyltransferase family 2 protein [Candidatus Delongbacteria bacterium]|nr:glycosyltransferase family 2 protein [Candidatus Delongbacteria bacterium]
MIVEFLISTMNRTDLKFLESMFQNNEIHDVNAVVINQCTKIDIPDIRSEYKNIKVISVNEKGLSRSRNLALKNATGDILVIADDDVTYEKDVVNKIKSAYEQLIDADIITFRVKVDDSKMFKNYPKTIVKHNYRTINKISSIEISFKRNKVEGVVFDNFFGLGSEFPMGEENIFLHDLLKKGKMMWYHPSTIVCHEEITSGIQADAKQYYETKGAVYYRMFSILFIIANIIFLIRHKEIHRKKNISFFNAFLIMFEGGVKYRSNKSKAIKLDYL